MIYIKFWMIYIIVLIQIEKGLSYWIYLCVYKEKGVVHKKNSKVKAKSKISRVSDIESIYRLLKKSSRPVILTGEEVRYSNAVKEFNSLIKALKIPVVSSWSGVDTIDSKNKLYFGHVGVYGSRAANFIVQNSDCLLSLGSRLDTRITGGKPNFY